MDIFENIFTIIIVTKRDTLLQMYPTGYNKLKVGKKQKSHNLSVHKVNNTQRLI